MERENPKWQDYYMEAILEVDLEKRLGRIQAAESSIVERLHELKAKADEQIKRQALQEALDGHAEQQAIRDALKSLAVLKQQILKSD